MNSVVRTGKPDLTPVCGASVNLTYDALGRMVEQNRGGSYTQVVYAPSGGKLALLNGSTLQQAFVPLPAGAQAVYNGSGLAYYRHGEWLGSSRLASTPSRTLYYDGAYAPYGESYSETGTADRDYTGQNQDTASGLYDFLYREYHPVSGRWISPDPAGLAAVDLSNPQSLNRYAYVTNRPTVMFDQYGLFVAAPPPDDDGGGGFWILPYSVLAELLCFYGDCMPTVPDYGEPPDDPGSQGTTPKAANKSKNCSKGLREAHANQSARRPRFAELEHAPDCWGALMGLIQPCWRQLGFGRRVSATFGRAAAGREQGYSRSTLGRIQT